MRSADKFRISADKSMETADKLGIPADKLQAATKHTLKKGDSRPDSGISVSYYLVQGIAHQTLNQVSR